MKIVQTGFPGFLVDDARRGRQPQILLPNRVARGSTRRNRGIDQTTRTRTASRSESRGLAADVAYATEHVRTPLTEVVADDGESAAATETKHDAPPYAVFRRSLTVTS